jgi:hypothetical protein
MKTIAINIGANTNAPGFRGPVYPDGTFEYIPIPESEPTRVQVPTYDDLDLGMTVPDEVGDVPVHLDPEFSEYPCCERYTYGDEHGVKAGPLSTLEMGDYLLFYATLAQIGEPASCQPPEWGAYIIGGFRVQNVVTGEEYEGLSESEQAPFRNNAHIKRENFDARVLVLGDADESGLYEKAVPLSREDGGTVPNRIVTELSSDSGKGPWWRRVLRFEKEGSEEVMGIMSERSVDRNLPDKYRYDSSIEPHL